VTYAVTLQRVLHSQVPLQVLPPGPDSTGTLSFDRDRGRRILPKRVRKANRRRREENVTAYRFLAMSPITEDDED
ncbi:unnamed protein product, partial [Symbiodinium microadriaticum]